MNNTLIHTITAGKITQLQLTDCKSVKCSRYGARRKTGKISEVEKDSKFKIYCFHDILIEVLNLSIHV